ncbi:hypothetical protein [Nonomuraea typhae]|uniref:hypothetical protein n=1 Tax=Nonomuraea typhae TaxID=2603600 RepID=UPI0012F988E0|nr:hypothetical protein [Nonomuraea typhae]
MGLYEISASRSDVATILHDTTYTHVQAAHRITQLGVTTTESSVRRARRTLDIPTTTQTTDTTASHNSPATDGELELTDEDRIKDLRRANLNLMNRLAKAKASKAELVEAVFQAARDAATGLNLDPVPAPTAPAGPGREEVAVAMLADWQLGKVTPTYNSAVCEERINLYADKLLRITDIQRAGHPVNELRVWILGDIVEGELIFGHQPHTIDSSLYRQTVVDGPRILGTFLRRMLATFDRVHVTAVVGNHGVLSGGRRSRFNPETNADRMLYRIVEAMFEHEPRITFTIPDGHGESSWYAIDRIGDQYACLLFHGDQIRGGFAGFPFYGLGKKVWGWKSGAIPETFNDVAFGHWHQLVEVTLNGTIARGCGSPESFNTYAQEQLAAMGRPSQRLMFIDSRKGDVTSEYKIWLADGLYD